MRVEIRGQGLELSDHIRERTRTRLHFSVGRFSPDIVRVTVRYADLNGPRGGRDKRCRISMQTHALGTIITEGVDTQLDSALATASDRVSRALIRARDRARFRRTAHREPLQRSPRPPGF